jgi:hypothetical protein
VPISDSYVIQYLLDGTVAVPAEIHLVSLFRGLIKAVVSQCTIRCQRAEQNQEEIRERISHRVLFGEPRKATRRSVSAGSP